MISNNESAVIMSDEVSNVQLLFEECRNNDPDMNKIDEYIIRICNNKEDINICFQIHSCKWTTLHMACKHGHHEIVKRLLENSNCYRYPIDVNAIGNRCDETPLHLACQKQSSFTVRTLLLHPNIDVNKCNFVKETPMHYACYKSGKAVVIELLKHRDINLNAMDNRCVTPLHLSCFINGSAAVVQLLLDHTTINDINAVDVDGNTPLHTACRTYSLSTQRIKIVRKLLMQPSIIINKKNNNNDTPLDICKYKLNNPCNQYYNEIIQLLEDSMSQRRWQVFCFMMNYDTFKTVQANQ